MSVIADTDVVSFFFKEDSRTALYKPHFFAIPKFISFMTLAELRRWQRQSSWGMMKTRKFEELIADFGVIFADEELCDVWARVKMDAQQKGRPIESEDAWIAATALQFGIPLVTHNRKHYENVEDLIVISES